MLFGRVKEIQHIHNLLDDARAGHGRVLTVIADPGLGKTALLDAVEDAAAGWRVLRCTGIENGSDLPFAGLRRLLGAVGEDADNALDALPAPQRLALDTALGQLVCDTADRFCVGLAVLSLLAELAAPAPVLCLIDDAHLLDRPSLDALLFAARRLDAEHLALLFAGDTQLRADGLPELRLAPLDHESAAALLAHRFPDLTPDARDRVLRAAAGNPLAASEFPAMAADGPVRGDVLPRGDAASGGLSRADRMGGGSSHTAAEVGDAEELTRRLCAGYADRIAGYPAAVRTALLVVAAEETGDLELVARVLDRLGYTGDALTAAADTGLLHRSGQAVTFRHPLQRTAAYRAADAADRTAVHLALAAELGHDPVRHAWQLAHARTTPDETVAAALEAAADYACAHTAHASAVSALEAAARLTPDLVVRGRRLTRAVETALAAGCADQALRLADTAEQLCLAPGERARILGVRATIEFEVGSPHRAYQIMLDAAEHVADLDPQRAAWLLIDAGRIAWTAGDLADFRTAYHRLAELALGPMREPLLSALRGPMVMQTGDPVGGIALIRANVAFGRTVPLEMISLRHAFAAQSALIGDMEVAREQLTELAGLVCERGMITWCPSVGCVLANAELILGRFREAEIIAAHSLRVAADTGQPGRVATAEALLAMIAAVRGDEARCRELAGRTLRHEPGDFNAIDVTHGHWALALLDLGYGRYRQALDRLRELYEQPKQARGHWTDLLADLIEAAVRARRPDRASAAMSEIDTWAAALDKPWAEGIALRCRGLLSGDGELFGKALGLHAAAQRWYDHARTGLLYGEWLRREGREAQARAALAEALETFERLGAVPWADRARAELRGLVEQGGETGAPRESRPPGELRVVDVYRVAEDRCTEEHRVAADRRTEEHRVAEAHRVPGEPLTTFELQVVRLAAAGLTERDIAAKVFRSVRTVGHHLDAACRKLGVDDRATLRTAWSE
ncbi:AAA family ATPase [Nocardia otitidiscaviarum]|uniref:helix-turn-helix transcriptional regulator n=1 Tax=Nocardia otitidiscaviarum TaxID=1823 RepID=UPI00163D63A8|nr:LuxR family transcriptional regulator [Nocardia otitidiscaviarum]MCP9622850.1 AAA family ATPase [Nocardia otitidiscaviarum]